MSDLYSNVGGEVMHMSMRDLLACAIAHVLCASNFVLIQYLNGVHNVTLLLNFICTWVCHLVSYIFSVQRFILRLSF